jgi:hypothetical protein
MTRRGYWYQIRVRHEMFAPSAPDSARGTHCYRQRGAPPHGSVARVEIGPDWHPTDKHAACADRRSFFVRRSVVRQRRTLALNQRRIVAWLDVQFDSIVLERAVIRCIMRHVRSVIGKARAAAPGGAASPVRQANDPPGVQVHS